MGSDTIKNNQQIQGIKECHSKEWHSRNTLLLSEKEWEWHSFGFSEECHSFFDQKFLTPLNQIFTELGLKLPVFEICYSTFIKSWTAWHILKRNKLKPVDKWTHNKYKLTKISYDSNIEFTRILICTEKQVSLEILRSEEFLCTPFSILKTKRNVIPIFCQGMRNGNALLFKRNV